MRVQTVKHRIWSHSPQSCMLALALLVPGSASECWVVVHSRFVYHANNTRARGMELSRQANKSRIIAVTGRPSSFRSCCRRRIEREGPATRGDSGTMGGIPEYSTVLASTKQ
ncbi:hypothetical protein AB1N83_008540 [Pleurotus pulmonarius]